MANRYGRGIGEDAESVALAALVEAANSYTRDPAEMPDYSFSVYAGWVIRRHLWKTKEGLQKRSRKETTLEFEGSESSRTELPESTVQGAESAEAAAVRNLEVEAVQDALTYLPERERQLVVDIWWEGRSQADVAREWGTSRNRVNFILKRATERLRRQLEDRAGGPL